MPTRVTAEVMVVPVQAIVGTVSLGAKPRCFVLGSDGQPEPREIVVGMSNQRLAEVKSGINEGEKVVFDPASLLGEEGETKSGKNEDDSRKASSEGSDGAGAGKK